MKVKTIKNSKQFPYQNYTHKVGKHKFEANVFEDDGGELIAKIGNDFYILRENAKLKHWIDEAQEMYNFYHNLVDFLEEVNYLQKNKKK